MNTMKLCATCLFGLEGLTSSQLKRLGFRDVSAENGRVTFSGDETALAKALVNLRFAERVMINIGSFDAVSFTELFDRTYELPWERFIPVDGAFPVTGSCVGSVLHSVPDCQKIIKKAAARRIMEKYRLSWAEEKAELYQIRFTVIRDRVELYIDASGQALHKRGYRAVGTAAPLRETLAAAMADLSGYRGKGVFWDPFCGSGTIAIEAALIALNRAPGLNRAFDAMNWRWVNRKIWPQVRQEASAAEFTGGYEILASDIDEGALEISRSNASKAGVSKLIEFFRADAGELELRRGPGRIVANPPYGERMMERREASLLMRRFGKRCSAMDGWSFCVLTADADFESSFGSKADKKRKLYNGMIKCDLYMYPDKERQWKWK